MSARAWRYRKVGQWKAPGQRNPGKPPRQRPESGTDVPGFGFVPHPLDVDIRQLAHSTLRLDDGGREVVVYVAECPDGCGLVAWTDFHLPFSAPDLEAVRAQIETQPAR